MDYPSFQELFRVGRDEILVDNPALGSDVVNRDGTDANVLVAGGAAMADECINQLAEVESGLWLDSAEGIQLDRLLFDRYNLVRKPAAPGVVTERFFIGGVGGAAPVPTTQGFTIPSGFLVGGQVGGSGVQYMTVADCYFPANSVGPVYVTCTSTVAGANQQVPQGVLTNLVSSLPAGAPTSGLQCINDLASAGANDAEEDDDFRERGRRFWTTAGLGTLSALEAGALAYPGVVQATALETVDYAQGVPNRAVELVIADKYTAILANLNQVSPQYQQQSQALATAVFNSLSDVRPAGIFVRVMVAQVVLQPISLNLHFIAGYDVTLTALQAQAAISAQVQLLQPGQSLSVAYLQQALQLVPGLQLMGDEIASPAGTVVANVGQVIRTPMQLVNLSASSPAVQNASNAAAFILNPDWISAIANIPVKYQLPGL